MVKRSRSPFLRACRHLFGSCMLFGLIVGSLTHAGRLPMQPGVLISTYFIVATTLTFFVLVKNDPEFAVLPDGGGSVYVKAIVGAKIVVGVSLAGILFLNAMYLVKVWAA